MKKVFVFLLIFSLLTFRVNIKNKETAVYMSNQIEITNLVNSFGDNLKMVSLQSPNKILKESIKKYYSKYLTKDLLNHWLNNPKLALGRLTSSPWPECVEIIDIVKKSNHYIVSGYIIETTSLEKVKGGYANKKPLILKVVQVNNQWKIDAVLVINTFY